MKHQLSMQKRPSKYATKGMIPPMLKNKIPRLKPIHQAISRLFTTWPRVGTAALTAGVIGLVAPTVSNALSGTLTRADLNGSNGFIVSGLTDAPSVAIVGDINDDAIDDFVITQSTENYVVFGTTAGFPASFDITSIDGSNGFVIVGNISQASRLGDVNKDGVEDLGLAAGDTSYVVFGNDQGFPARFPLSSLDGNNGFIIDGAGSRIAEGQDVNGDEFADIVVSGTSAYVIFGRDQFPASVPVNALNGSNGFKITGTGGDASGTGDINHDGVSDIIVSAVAEPNQIAHIVYGNDTNLPATIEASELDGSDGFTVTIDQTDFFLDPRSSVSEGGDINGDGIDDALIGLSFEAYGGAVDANAIFTIFGNPAGFDAEMQIDAQGGLPFYSITEEYLGKLLCGANTRSWCNQSTPDSGDLNGDGFNLCGCNSPWLAT